MPLARPASEPQLFSVTTAGPSDLEFSRVLRTADPGGYGRRLLARLSASRGERCLSKFQQWAAADEMPAHFPTIYAAQHALFHLPTRLLVPAYAYWEWSAAGGDPAAFAREVDDLCRLAQSLLPAPSSVHAAAVANAR